MDINSGSILVTWTALTGIQFQLSVKHYKWLDLCFVSVSQTVSLARVFVYNAVDVNKIVTVPLEKTASIEERTINLKIIFNAYLIV